MIAKVLALVLVVVVGFLALTQVSALEDSITAATTGPLSLLAEHLTFFWLLIMVVLVVVLLVGILAWVVKLKD